MSLLAQIAIFLAAAVIAIPIFRRFKLGSVLGYLAAGIERAVFWVSSDGRDAALRQLDKLTAAIEPFRVKEGRP